MKQTLFAILLFTSAAAFAQNGTVFRYQKVSDTDGGFGGTLDNSDQFGVSADSIGDLDGDGVVDIVVGAYLDDDGGTDRGAVWILFLNADGTVKSEQKISDTQGGFTGTLDNSDGFGVSVAGIGDLNNDGINDIAVGAFLDDDGGTDRGAVWILFLDTDGTVKSHQKISDTAGGFTGTLDNSDQFGASIAGIGDLDSDGNPDIAVGANADDDGGTDRGAVWILFLDTNGTVKSYQKISDTDGGFTGTLDDGDRFGTDVANIGDIDNDGIIDLAVGAQLDDDGGTNRGAVWILFMNTDGTVSSHQKISDTAGGFSGILDNDDRFGLSVSGAGDINGDDVEDILVSAMHDDDGGTDRGAAWVLFLNTDGTVASHQKISDTQGGFTATLDNSDKLGGEVAFLGDIDGDCKMDAVIAAHLDDDGGMDRGAIYIVSLNGVFPSGCTNNRYWVASSAGNWSDNANWSTTSGGTGGAIAPLSGHRVFFDQNGNGNCTINKDASALDFEIGALHSGTVSQGNYTLTVGDSGATFTGGTFSGGSKSIVIKGPSLINGNTFTSTSDTLHLWDDFTFSSGSFSHNNGTVRFPKTEIITGDITLYNVEFKNNQGAARTHNIASGTDVIVENDLAISGSYQITINTGNIEARGDIYVTNTASGGEGTATIKINGSGKQTLTGGTAEDRGRLPKIYIDKTGDTLHLKDNISAGNDWTYVQGIVDAGTSMAIFYDVIQIDAQGTTGTMAFNHVKTTGTPGSWCTLTGDIAINGNLYINNIFQPNNKTVNLAKSIVALGYISAGSSGNSRFIFDGTTQQTLWRINGVALTFENITINNPAGIKSLNHNINIWKQLALTNGVIDLPDANLVYMYPPATVSTPSAQSYVSGAVSKEGPTNFTFPTGKNGRYMPLKIGNLNSQSYRAEFFDAPHGKGTNRDCSLDSVSSCGYWVFTKYSGGGTSTATITLSWDENSCGITDPAKLRVARWNGSKWKNMGNKATTGDAAAGTIESTEERNVFDTLVIGHSLDGLYRHWVADANGNWNDTANWSSTSAGCSGAQPPTSANIAVFDNGSTYNCTINAAANVRGFRTQTGYTGTITHGANTVTVNDSGMTLTAGTITAGSAAVTVNGDFNLNGATFNKNTGTIVFSGANAQTITGSGALDFYNVTLSGEGIKTLGQDLSLSNDLDISSALTDLGSNRLTMTKNTTGALSRTTGALLGATAGALIRSTAAASWYEFPLMTKKQYPDTFVVKIKPSTASARQFEAATTGTGGIITAFDMATMGAETTGMQAVRNFNDTVQLRYTTNATDSIITVEVYSVAGAAYVTLEPGFYTVSPKNTLTLHSLHSIMAWYGLNTFSQISASGGNTCANWEYTVTFGQNNAVTSESVAYSDYLGRPCQGQARNLAENTVLTTRSVFDAYGRPMLTSLPAPTGSYFNYMTGFIKDASGGAYTYADYDTKTTLNNPAPVQSSTAGTVGNYYSSGGIEAYVPETSYPFVRTEALSSGARNAAAGEQYRMGNANNSESRSFTMTAPGDELEKIFGTDSTWKAEIKTNRLENKSVNITGGSPSVKTVTIDAGGRETVAYSAGGNAVAACYSGLGGCTTHAVTHTMLFDGTRTVDIHVPAAKVDSVKLPLPVYDVDMGINNVHEDSILYTITDVETNYVLQPTTDYTIDANRYLDFTATNGYNSGTHFLRVNFDYIATFYDLELGADTPNAKVEQRLDYSDWSAGYYDLAGNLRKSVSPKGINCSSPGTITMATTYDYSSMGRLIGKKSPDEGTVEMVYDSEGKLRFSQHDEQGTGRFSYINYDKHGRVVESGEYTTANGGHFFENYYKNNDVPACGPCYGTSGILDDLDSLDDANCAFVTTMQYDTACTLANAIPSGYTYSSSYTQHYTTGQVTKTSNDETDTWYGYDQQGRLAWMAQQLKDAGYTAERTGTDQQVMTLDYTYTLTGQVTKVEYNKNVAWEALTHNYTYDDDLRLSNVTIDTDVLAAEQIAAYQYYLTGALKRKELGNNLQGLDYIYTINGQLKSINHPSLDPAKDPGKDGAAGGSGSSRDVFGMSIDYHTNDYVRTGSDITSSSTGATSHYNGLIDAVRWNVLYEPDIIKSGTSNETLISSASDEVMYRYHYNAFNWLDSARFGVYNTATPAFTLKDAYKLWGDDANTAITYDDNGNIENLKRSGYSGGDPGGLVMDELNYTYTGNTNKLASILDDAITSYTNDFDASTTKNFTYNAIGQMTASEAEGIDEVAYTPSGKVEYVAYSNSDTAFYWYNDKGQKYKSQLKPNGGNSVFSWYVSDAAGNIMGIYSFTEGGDSIKLAEQPVYADGRVGILHPAQDSVVYEITDHQGNVRVAFTEHGDSTHIVAWTDFYPFGSPMPGRYENSSDYRFSYQGQEKAVGDDANTGWDHFELRMYNGQLGRFNSPDPYGQFHSPYVGMGNSPINGSDPSGGYYVTDFTGSTHFRMVGSDTWLVTNLGWSSTQLANYHITGTPYSEQELRMQALAEYRQQEVAVLSRYGGDRVLARFAMRDLEDKYGAMLYSEQQADMQASMAMAQAATQSARERADARFNATEGRFAQLAERSAARAAQEALRGRAARESDALDKHNAEYTGAFDAMDGSGKILAQMERLNLAWLQRAILSGEPEIRHMGQGELRVYVHQARQTHNVSITANLRKESAIAYGEEMSRFAGQVRIGNIRLQGADTRITVKLDDVEDRITARFSQDNSTSITYFPEGKKGLHFTEANRVTLQVTNKRIMAAVSSQIGKGQETWSTSGWFSLYVKYPEQ